MGREKERKPYKVHRLLGKAFLENGEIYFNDSAYKINHIDECKYNNKLENLEFVTILGNNVHSHGIPVEKYDIKTGITIKKYDCITSASKDTPNATRSMIKKVCENIKKEAYDFGWRYAEKK